ncbi:MAG: hypothetical protein EZS28_014036 [Streblomastix strix]|uniref:Uncharacterized protein n=1 Tax=Streblomastix strix TaxID=222440 RepID=A0A5J4W7K4_9EUKA|nr:MAG: hypothetical protein EZS28_014036 [Streblomastix strix]
MKQSRNYFEQNNNLDRKKHLEQLELDCELDSARLEAGMKKHARSRSRHRNSSKDQRRPSSVHKHKSKHQQFHFDDSFSEETPIVARAAALEEIVLLQEHEIIKLGRVIHQLERQFNDIREYKISNDLKELGKVDDNYYSSQIENNYHLTSIMKPTPSIEFPNFTTHSSSQANTNNKPSYLPFPIKANKPSQQSIPPNTDILKAWRERVLELLIERRQIQAKVVEQLESLRTERDILKEQLQSMKREIDLQKRRNNGIQAQLDMERAIQKATRATLSRYEDQIKKKDYSDLSNTDNTTQQDQISKSSKSRNGKNKNNKKNDKNKNILIKRRRGIQDEQQDEQQDDEDEEEDQQDEQEEQEDDDDISQKYQSNTESESESQDQYQIQKKQQKKKKQIKQIKNKDKDKDKDKQRSVSSHSISNKSKSKSRSSNINKKTTKENKETKAKSKSPKKEKETEKQIIKSKKKQSKSTKQQSQNQSQSESTDHINSEIYTNNEIESDNDTQQIPLNVKLTVAQSKADRLQLLNEQHVIQTQEAEQKLRNIGSSIQRLDTVVQEDEQKLSQVEAERDDEVIHSLQLEQQLSNERDIRDRLLQKAQEEMEQRIIIQEKARLIDFEREKAKEKEMIAKRLLKKKENEAKKQIKEKEEEINRKDDEQKRLEKERDLLVRLMRGKQPTSPGTVRLLGTGNK